MFGRVIFGTCYESQFDISQTVDQLYEILGLHGGDYEEHYRAARDAV